MELTSKQRAQLRGMASTLDTIVHVGVVGWMMKDIIKSH